MPETIFKTLERPVIVRGTDDTALFIKRWISRICGSPSYESAVLTDGIAVRPGRPISVASVKFETWTDVGAAGGVVPLPSSPLAHSPMTKLCRRNVTHQQFRHRHQPQ